MNLQEMLAEALEKLQNMTAVEFEAALKKAGYDPVRKFTFTMSKPKFVEQKYLTREISYEKCISIKNDDPIDFSNSSANDTIFQLAA